MDIKMTVKDNLTPALKRIAKRGDDLMPVMDRIENEIMKPMRTAAWGSSGLRSRSGELRNAIATWHGKYSAGITLRSKAGRDLILPKAATHMGGAKKGSFGRQRKSAFKVKGYFANGRRVKAYTKKAGVFPWGDIQARVFFPEEVALERKRSAIIAMIKEHITNA